MLVCLHTVSRIRVHLDGYHGHLFVDSALGEDDRPLVFSRDSLTGDEGHSVLSRLVFLDACARSVPPPPSPFFEAAEFVFEAAQGGSSSSAGARIRIKDGGGAGVLGPPPPHGGGKEVLQSRALASTTKEADIEPATKAEAVHCDPRPDGLDTQAVSVPKQRRFATRSAYTLHTTNAAAIGHALRRALARAVICLDCADSPSLGAPGRNVGVEISEDVVYDAPPPPLPPLPPHSRRVAADGGAATLAAQAALAPGPASAVPVSAASGVALASPARTTTFTSSTPSSPRSTPRSSTQSSKTSPSEQHALYSRMVRRPSPLSMLSPGALDAIAAVAALEDGPVSARGLARSFVRPSASAAGSREEFGGAGEGSQRSGAGAKRGRSSNAQRQEAGSDSVRPPDEYYSERLL